MEQQPGESYSGENDKATENSDASSENWFPSPEIYSPEISTEKWIELLKILTFFQIISCRFGKDCVTMGEKLPVKS